MVRIGAFAFASVLMIASTPSSFMVVASSVNAVDMGTTLVAIKFEDGIVVAADSQTSLGRYVSNRDAEKLERFLSDSCFVMRSGSAAETQFLVREGRRFFLKRARRYFLSSSIFNLAEESD